jgi:hypothetical protein
MGNQRFFCPPIAFALGGFFLFPRLIFNHACVMKKAELPVNSPASVIYY